MAPLLPPGKADSTGVAAKRSVGRALSRAYTARLRPAGSRLDAARWEQDTDLEAGTEAQVGPVAEHSACAALCTTELLC
jgi:hypothetical protein